MKVFPWPHVALSAPTLVAPENLQGWDWKVSVASRCWDLKKATFKIYLYCISFLLRVRMPLLNGLHFVFQS